MKICVRCGKEIQAIAEFCQFCGSRQTLVLAKQNGCSNNSKSSAFARLSMNIISAQTKLLSIQSDITSGLDNLNNKIIDYELNQCRNFHADFLEEPSLYYKEASKVIFDLRKKFRDFDSQYSPLLNEAHSAILNELGEDIDLSTATFDEKIFDKIKPNITTIDLSEIINEILEKICYFFYAFSDLICEVSLAVIKCEEKLSIQHNS